MEPGFVSSWAKFVCRAAGENITDIWELLPRYTSLLPPPQHTMQYLEYLVVTMQQLMGPLPVTDQSLEHQRECYLPWLHMVLSDFEEAQDTPDAPRLFSMLPQSSNHTQFITISSTSLHKLLKAAGIANVPSLSANKGAKEFIQHQESWWNQYTACINFSKRTQQSRRCFKFQVQTDGVSVSVLMFQPFAEASTQTNIAPPPPPPGRKRKRQQQGSSRKALFTAVVHSQQAADSLHGGRLCQSKYESLSWSCSRWQEASGIKFRLQKAELWISRKADLKAALLTTPTAKVASSAQFLHHIRHRMQHTAAAHTHFGDRRHRQLRWRSFIKRQQAYSAICKEISGGSKDTVVAYGDAKFSSSCCKGNPSTPTVSLRRKLGHCCQECSLTSHRHLLPDGAELELVEMGARRDAQTKPARPPLLFIHGASHGAWCFAENFLPWFAQHGHDCFAVSLRGHGTSSDQSACSDTYAQSNDDLAHVIASLPQPPVLIAHSMGGFFGQRYLVEMADKQQLPPLAGVVMLASASLTACIPNMEWWHAQQSSMHAVKVIWWMMTSAVFKNASADKQMLFSPDLLDADFQRYYEQLRSGRQALPANFKELRNFLPKVEACAEAAKQLPIPIGVMIAGDDAVIMRHQVEANAAYFGVQPIVLEGVAHDVMLDTRWEQAAQTLHTWLQGIPALQRKFDTDIVL
ncbi:TPA: hypothetical protein ACH3X1_004553 [Trebouxia sp. C0004]